MKRIVIGGQIDKQKVADITAKVAGDRATIEIKSDIEAAMAIKTGMADIYLGACNTGGGGALAMAIALLGMGECATISMPGYIKSEEEIKAEVEAGKKAYGFTAQHAEEVVPIILKYLL
ncbi:DUF2620 domain-containing protein [Clostridium paraputrificum]|uniref:DUF2620 domain-containing protein n=1 Tax=Clostridium paraputrificum TaxID=29363 RepID=UPI00374ECA43